MTGRAVEEWVGSHPDAPIPTSVKRRIWLREGGKCSITGAKINAIKDPYDFEHRVPLSMGGGHRETNIVLALREAHRRKTAEEAGARAKADRVFAKHHGLKRPKGWGPRSKKLNGEVSMTARARREGDMG